MKIKFIAIATKNIQKGKLNKRRLPTLKGIHELAVNANFVELKPKWVYVDASYNV